MKTSASQLETLDLCARKWFFKSKMRLPEIPKGATEFGTIFHECAARFLRGEKDLFPEGWSKNLSPADASEIVVMVNAGIDAGYLERRPGSEVETEFHLTVEGIDLIGFQDHRTKIRVEDHKTSKSVSYLKGPKGLRDSIQMNTYGKERLENIRRLGEPPPPLITLAHNQFVRASEETPVVVKRAEAEVTPAEIEAFWAEKIVPLVRKQIELTKLENPFDIEDPPPKACRAFGGCPYVSICSGSEEPETYRRRITYLINQKKEPTMTDQVQPRKPSDFLAERMKKAAASAAQPSVNPPAPAAPAVVAKAPQQPSSDQPPPPWFNPGCPMCANKRPGFNLQLKKPCRICTSITKVSTAGFEWEIDDQGTVTWRAAGAKVAALEPAASEDAGSKTAYSADDLYQALNAAKSPEAIADLVTTAEAVLSEADQEIFMATVAAKVQELNKPEPEVSSLPPSMQKIVEKMEAAAAAPVASAAPAPAKPPKAAKAKEEPAPAAEADVFVLTLLVGCAAIRGMEMVPAEEVLSAKYPNYWKAENVFDARKQVRLDAEAIAKAYAGQVIVQQGRCPDVDNLIASLIPFATTIVRGTVQ